MRILPDPYDGLHPAVTHKPAPLSCSPWTISPEVGGSLGIFGWAVGRALKRPGLGTKTAAWATVVYLVAGVSVDEYMRRRRIIPFLESKGVKVPKRKLIERPFEIDQDNFSILGMLVGVGIAGARRQPWSVFGWKRFVGALSFGAFGGAMSGIVCDLDGYRAALQRTAREREVAKLYEPQMKQFILESFYGKDAQGSTEPSVGMTPLQKLLKQAGPGGVATEGHSPNPFDAPGLPFMNPETTKDIDEEDPQPHLSEMRDGERVFKPDTNYLWSAGADAVPKLESHISTLKDRRSRLAKEAELLWHDLAEKEAHYYNIPVASDGKGNARSLLQNMNHVHINLWLEIGMLDWMIADSQKNIRQVKAMDKNSQWLPGKPDESKIAPKHTLKILQELEREVSGALQEVDFVKEEMAHALNDPDVEIVDPVTGKRASDAHESMRQQMEELEKLREGAALDADNLRKLIEEAEGRIRNAKE